MKKVLSVIFVAALVLSIGATSVFAVSQAGGRKNRRAEGSTNNANVVETGRNGNCENCPGEGEHPQDGTGRKIRNTEGGAGGPNFAGGNCDGTCENCQDGGGERPQDGTGKKIRNAEDAADGPNFADAGRNGSGAGCDGTCENCQDGGERLQDGAGNQYGKGTEKNR
ncbi:MAG: hypothetical protein ACOX75_03835 [Lachnospiraceae bacterium]